MAGDHLHLYGDLNKPLPSPRTHTLISLQECYDLVSVATLSRARRHDFKGNLCLLECRQENNTHHLDLVKPDPLLTGKYWVLSRHRTEDVHTDRDLLVC